MAAAAAVSFVGARAPVPFCDQRFKFVRVVADAVSGLCLALFYKIVSVCCWMFSATLASHYGSLARYQFQRMGSLITYLRFGEEVIDFSVNSSTLVKERVGGSEYEALQAVYGKEAIERWSRIGTKEIPLKKEDLARRQMAIDGCCFGMNLDFLSQYLQRVKKGASPLEAVKSIAPRYVEGAPKEAQLAQIFYKALDISNLQKEEEGLWDQNFCAKCTEICKQLKEEKFSFGELIPELVRRIFLERREEIKKIEILRDQLVARVFGLTLQNATSYLLEEKEKFADFVNRLPEGAFQVHLGSTSGKAHGIVFVKTSKGPHFIFDPNPATLAVEPAKSAERIWSLARGSFVRFSSYALV